MISPARLAAAAALAFLTGPLLSLPALAAPPVSVFTLENGMQAVVIEDHRAPVVTHMVWYRVGAADEPPGKSGIAHFLEHLMFKGTDEIPDAAFSKIIAANGGQDNAFTSRDYTGYFQRIAADRLPLVMKMEADRMRDLRFSDEQARTERDVILEERNSRVDNEPGSLLREQRDAAMYLNHPYGIPIIGWRHEVEKLTREDALAFYRRYYAPDNAILVVAGDVDPEEVERLANEYYGPLAPTPGLGPRMRPMEPPARAPRRVALEHERVRQPYVIRSYLAPALRDGLERAAALGIMAEVLGGSINARLQQELKVKRKIAIDAGAYYSSDSRDYGEVGVYVVPAPGVTLAEAEAAMDEVLAAFLASDGPTAEEMTRIKAAHRASFVYAQDSQFALARRYGAGLTSGLTIEQIEAEPEAYESVTAAQVMEAAREVLDLDRSVTATLSAPEEKPQG